MPKGPGGHLMHRGVDLAEQRLVLAAAGSVLVDLVQHGGKPALVVV
ncbi:hypothetical protein [Kutzneria buriramensis]